jgi:hypothetical protein
MAGCVQWTQVIGREEFIMLKALCAAAALAMAASIAAAQPAPTQARAVDSTSGGDRFFGGGSVRQVDPVAGDAIGVGGDLELDAQVEGDAVLAGGSVRLGGRVGQDLYAAGGKVIVEGAIGRNARVAGGQAEIGPKGQVNGNLAIAGGQVTLRGPVKGHVQVAGGEVLIDAAVDGDVRAATGELTLGPNARIGGKLVYRSREEVRRDPAAQVAGGIERGPPVAHGTRAAQTHRAHGFEGGWIWTAGLIVLAAVFAAAFPAISQRVGAQLRAHPGFALLFGFIGLVCIPVAAVILMITIIGLPLALLVLLLYFVLLILGYVVAAVTLGDAFLARFRAQAASRTGWRIGAAVLAVLALALLGRIPFLGGLVALTAMLAGMGAIVLAFRRREASGEPGSVAHP